MAYGLGKNSPVVIRLGKSNYGALIERHGQWVRWRTARKCPCLTTENEPDVHCEKCGGSGDIYDFQKYYNETLSLKVRDNIIELPEGNADCEILKVYDSKGNEFNFTKTGNFVEITGGAREAKQNEMIELLIRQSAIKHSDCEVIEKDGNGFYRVSGVETPPSKLEGVYYKAPGDVLKVERLETAEGELVEIKGYRQNMILAESEANTLTAYGVDYILPHKFIILSQELSKADEQLLNAHNGEAVCTFPYMFDVAENDCITVLSGTMTAKALIEKRDGARDDVIPEFFVAGVESLETKERAYREGEDFVLTGTNRLHWLGEDKPETGEAMSLVYKYNPTYRVAKNIPMLRTSEDQRIPRKAILRLFSAFAESRGLQNG